MAENTITHRVFLGLKECDLQACIEWLWEKGFRPEYEYDFEFPVSPGVQPTLAAQELPHCAWLEFAGISAPLNYQQFRQVAQNEIDRWALFAHITDIPRSVIDRYVWATVEPETSGGCRRLRCQAVTAKGTRCKATIRYVRFRDFDPLKIYLCSIHEDRTMNVEIESHP